MEALATASFLVSLVGIVVLFWVKSYEEKKGEVLLPMVRVYADQHAIELKRLLSESKTEMRKLGPASIRVARTALHDIALSLAALSRASERQAHRLADMVSHKRNFERRESTNTFLRQVGERHIKDSRKVSSNGTGENGRAEETDGLDPQ